MAVGVFGLQVAYKLKRTELLSLEDTHGWFGGGLVPAIPATVSTVDRIDFSNDTSTASTKGSLSVARRSLSATGNSNYGWFGGGWFTPSTPQINYSTVDRIDFSNDSSTASVRGSLSAARYDLAATGNSNYGWFGGGILFPGTKSTVDRIDFSNDNATASPRGPLSLARTKLTATGNSNYGWFGGGVVPGAPTIYHTTVDRIDFSNDNATASARGPLSAARYSRGATANSNYGWFGGGTTAPSFISAVDRIDFANDLSTTLVRGPLTVIRGELSAFGNSNYGWFGGGRFPHISTVDRINFANDSSTASIRGPLTSTRYSYGGTSGQAKSSSIRLQKAGNFGWFGGGTAAANISVVERLNFTNDLATASPRGLLSTARQGLSATGNLNFGWFGGGNSSSVVDRINYANDSVSASPRGPLSLGRTGLAATGNSNYGWFGGGLGYSRVDRINFSNDSVTASIKGSLNQTGTGRYGPGATGNSNYGWWGGGYGSPPLSGNVSLVDRIDFSNDGIQSLARGTFPATAIHVTATGNSQYGWFAGGAGTSVVRRINFSNDSINASLRGPLNFASSPASYLMGAASDKNYGWFAGGTPGSGQLTSSNRIDFSNDSVSATTRGSLITARYWLAGASNNTR